MRAGVLGMGMGMGLDEVGWMCVSVVLLPCLFVYPITRSNSR